jgi:starch-binding outer membrane protein, SusD/RagB family
MRSNIAILAGVFLVLTSCNELLTESPKSTYSSSNFYSTEEGLTAGILGIYNDLREFYDRPASAALYLGTDIGCTRASANYNADFDAYQWSTESDYLYDIWNDHYEMIMHANVLLADIEEADEIDLEFKYRIIAEIKFLRSLAYFRLVQLWGPVPILLGGETEEMPREPVGKVYELIVQDLEDALQPDALPVDKDEIQPGRVTYFAAKALLGKVYLTMASYKKHGSTFEGLMSEAGKADYGYQSSINQSSAELYQLAESTLKDVIDNGGYELLDDYSEIFVIDNKNFNSESIFEVQFSTEVTGNWTKVLGYPSWVSGRPDFASWTGQQTNRAVPSFYLFYDEDDQRRDYNLPPDFIRRTKNDYIRLIPREEEPRAQYEVLIAGEGGFFAYMGFAKYRWGDTWDGYHNYPGGMWTPNNGIMLRYADVLLMYAEASFEANGGIITQDGLNAINLVRERARGFDVDPSETPGFPNFTTSDVTLDVILDERARELCIEHHRKFDLLRTNKLQEAIKTRRPINDNVMIGPIDISDHRWLWPIPQYEIDIVINKELLWQNPGY